MDGHTHETVEDVPASALEPDGGDEAEPTTTDDLFSDADPAEVLENGACPWCDEYTGDYPKSHARSAHPDAMDEVEE